MRRYMDTLSEEEKASVTIKSTTSVYRFDDGQRMTVAWNVIFPCVLAEKVVTISADVAECTIPLLFSRSSMKKAGMVIDFGDDTLPLFGKTVELVLLSDYLTNEPKELVYNLHRQFAHSTAQKLKNLPIDARRGDPNLLKCVDQVTEGCEICRKYKRRRPRPVVAFSCLEPLMTLWQWTSKCGKMAVIF